MNDILSKQHSYTLHSISYLWNSLEIIGNKLFTNAESSMAAATTASASSSLTASTTSTFFLGPNPCTLFVIENSSSNVDARSRRLDGNIVYDIYMMLMKVLGEIDTCHQEGYRNLYLYLYSIYVMYVR